MSAQGANQVSTQFNKVKGTMTGTTSAAQPLNKQMVSLDQNNVKTAKSTKTMGQNVKGTKQPIDTTAQSLGKYNKTVNSTGAVTQGAAAKFQRNRGLIFGMTMLTSGAIEAVGMLGMYNDQVKTVKKAEEELSKVQNTRIEDTTAYKKAIIAQAEAQEKMASLEKAGKTDRTAYTKASNKLAEAEAALNKMRTEGIEGSQDYEDAQNAVAKAQRGLQFVQRTMILSMTDLIPMSLFGCIWIPKS